MKALRVQASVRVHAVSPIIQGYTGRKTSYQVLKKKKFRTLAEIDPFRKCALCWKLWNPFTMADAQDTANVGTLETVLMAFHF